jgi:hypothetical protein
MPAAFITLRNIYTYIQYMNIKHKIIQLVTPNDTY